MCREVGFQCRTLIMSAAKRPIHLHKQTGPQALLNKPKDTMAPRVFALFYKTAAVEGLEC